MTKKFHHHLVLALFLFLSVVCAIVTVEISANTATSTGTTTYSATTTTSTLNNITTTTTLPCTGFEYSGWGNCTASGVRTRTVTGMVPSGCASTSSITPVLEEQCTYCVYKYDSTWGECINGIQKRGYTAPSGCNSPDFSQIQKTCTTTLAAPVACVYSYASTWGNCVGGYQTRGYTAPSGCNSPDQSQIKKTCTVNVTAPEQVVPIVCSYEYSEWSACSTSGKQTRVITKKSPSGCADGNPDVLRNCTYDSSTSSCSIQCSPWSVCSPAGIKSQVCGPSASGCPGETKTVTENCPPAICKFTYSEWGECSGGMQFRTILSTAPAGCVGGDSLLKKTCTATTNQAVQLSVQNQQAIVDPDIAVNDDWKKDKFKTADCQNQVCGGSFDPDSDGLANNDEFRYGTDPLNRDTDNDGKTDGEEVVLGTDPLRSSAKGEEDEMVFENPKEKGTAKEEIYRVTSVEMIPGIEGGSKKMKLTGKGPSDSYVNVYIYSGQPVIITVKTDSNGDWTYTIDKELENGDHEAYVAVTNNTGAIKAKSAPLPFVKTAEAISTAKAGEINTVQPTTQSGMSLRTLLFTFAFSFFGVVVAIILIGSVIKKIVAKSNNNY